MSSRLLALLLLAACTPDGGPDTGESSVDDTDPLGDPDTGGGDTDVSDTDVEDTDVEDTDVEDTDVEDTDGRVPEGWILSEDFEASAVGTVPDGWDDYVGWVVNGGQNLPGRDVHALVDGARAAEGAHALLAVGGSRPAQIAHALPDGTDRVFVRARVWSEQQLGAVPGRNHETLIALRAGSGTVSDEVRFGEIKGVLGTNEVPSDDISPRYEAWGGGPVIEAGAWHCIEVAFLGDSDHHAVRAWRDGTLVHEVTEPSQWNNRVLGERFLEGKFGEIVLGWHSFSNVDNRVWVDDVVVATDRIGCE